MTKTTKDSLRQELSKKPYLRICLSFKRGTPARAIIEELYIQHKHGNKLSKQIADLIEFAYAQTKDPKIIKAQINYLDKKFIHETNEIEALEQISQKTLQSRDKLKKQLATITQKND